MKKLNNTILNNIVEKFVKRKNYKEKKISNWLKLFNFIPFYSIFIFLILYPYALLKNKKIKEKRLDFMACSPFCYILVSLMFHSVLTVPLVFLFFSEVKFGIMSPNIIMMLTYMIVDLFIVNYVFKNEKLNILDINRKFHEEKVFSEMLTKEDFEVIMQSFDDRIVKQAISDSTKDGLSYGDLSNLDKLLNNEQETLGKINEKEFNEIFRNLNKKVLFKKLKGKNKIEMIQYFENLGIEINNKNKIINEEEHGFYSKIIPINNKDSTKAILKEEKNSFSARIIKNEKREEIIK